MIAAVCRSGNAIATVKFEAPLLAVDPQAPMNVE